MIKDIQITPKQGDVIPYANVPYTLRQNMFNQQIRPMCMNIFRPFYERPLGDISGVEKRPLIVYYGGGAWREVAPWRHAQELIYYARHGYVVASVDYTVSATIPFPAAVEDAKTAVRFLKVNAGRFGIDENRIAVMGDSAGAHLALMVAASAKSGAFRTDEYPDVTDEVQAAVDFFGPTDFGELLTDFDRENGLSFYSEFFGQALASAPEIATQASPITYVTPETPPVMLVHGTADTLVPIAHSERMYDALLQSGVRAELYRIMDAEHSDVHFSQNEMLDLVLEFLARTI